MRKFGVAVLFVVVSLAALGTAKAGAGPIRIVGASCKREWVDVQNTSNQTKNLQGFRLLDHNSVHRYFYESVNVPPGARVRVWAAGKTGGPIRRWFTGWGGHVWNDSGDRATLRNPNGTVVSTRNCDDVGGPPPPPPPPPPPGNNCHPSYSPCIAPGPDVDCAGGSGNGPRYVNGPVHIHGPDKYDLDSDNDGLGCE
jgi:hypothetical protein